MSSLVMPVGNGKIDRILRILMDDIRSGKHKVGEKLPSENQLVLSFGVSRTTIRSALRRLQELGMITSQRGVGSIVRARSAHHRYTQSFESVSDLQQYTVNTRIEVLEKQEITVDEIQAEWLGCMPGEKWWRVATLRFAKDDGALVTFSEIFVPYIYGTLLAKYDKTQAPIYTLIEKQRGESIAEVQQTIAAAPAEAEAAKWLKVPLRDPVLLIVRRYYSRNRQLLEVSRSLHPAESFNYSMSVRLSGGS